MGLHRLALHAAARHPTRHGPLVEAKRHDDGLRRTAMGEQGPHEGNGLSRSAQAVKCAALGGTERLAACGAKEALVLTRVDATIALADLASGGTRQVRAACCGGVHDCPPGSVGERPKRSMSGPPFCLQLNLTTVEWRATRRRERPEIRAVARVHFSTSDLMRPIVS